MSSYIDRMADAKTEIDRLRAELEKLRASPDDNAVQLHKVAALATTLNDENERLRAENARLKVCIAARDELLDVKNRPSPEGLSVEEKIIWQLGNMMDNVENHYGAPNAKREGQIYSTAVRILDDAILAKTAKEDQQ